MKKFYLSTSDSDLALRHPHPREKVFFLTLYNFKSLSPRRGCCESEQGRAVLFHLRISVASHTKGWSLLTSLQVSGRGVALVIQGCLVVALLGS